MMRAWQRSETGWGCGRSFQTTEEDEVIRLAVEHGRSERGADPDEPGLVDRLMAATGVGGADDTNSGAGTGKIGDVSDPRRRRQEGIARKGTFM
jgi:predicted small metal-binding protein